MSDEIPQAQPEPQLDIMSFYRPPFTGRAYYDDAEPEAVVGLTN